MPLSPAELQDPARVDLHESVKKALKSPMPGTTTLDAVIERCIVVAMNKIESGFSDLDRAMGRRGGRQTHAVPSPTTERLQKIVPNESGADDSTRGLIKSALAHKGQVVAGARRQR